MNAAQLHDYSTSRNTLLKEDVTRKRNPYLREGKEREWAGQKWLPSCEWRVVQNIEELKVRFSSEQNLWKWPGGYEQSFSTSLPRSCAAFMHCFHLYALLFELSYFLVAWTC